MKVKGCNKHQAGLAARIRLADRLQHSGNRMERTQAKHCELRKYPLCPGRHSARKIEYMCRTERRRFESSHGTAAHQRLKRQHVHVRLVHVRWLWSRPTSHRKSGSALRVFLFQHQMLFESIPHFNKKEKYMHRYQYPTCKTRRIQKGLHAWVAHGASCCRRC